MSTCCGNWQKNRLSNVQMACLQSRLRCGNDNITIALRGWCAQALGPFLAGGANSFHLITLVFRLIGPPIFVQDCECLVRAVWVLLSFGGHPMFFEFVSIFDHVILHVILDAILSEWMGVREVVIDLLLDSLDCPILVMRVLLVLPD